MLEPGTAVSAVWNSESRRVTVPFSLAEAFENYVSEAWAGTSSTRRLSSRQLDAFYRVKRLIPRRLQLTARRALLRWQGDPRFPLWPYDESVASLLRFFIRCTLVAAGRTELRFRWFWPENARAAIVLTHDVESARGLRDAIRIADLEEERGLRSSFNIVASWYRIDHGVVAELKRRGFEIGVHGVFHDRSMFASRAAFEEQQPALARAVDAFGADGFRSPATHRVHAWLGELPVEYDCSVPLSDPYEPQPGGCCSPWPFFIGRVVELPYTLPQDHTLFTLLRHRSIDVWLTQMDALERSFGLIQCPSHPDPGYLGDQDKRALYAEFLDVVSARPALWKPLPRELAAWWRERDTAVEPLDRAGTGVARYDQDRRDVVLTPPSSESQG